MGETAASTAYKKTSKGSLRPYVSGFILSLALTVTAYVLVTRHSLSTRNAMIAVAGLAVAQFLTQAVFFLHIGQESRPRWKMLAFLCMLVVVAILVIGSLWIMANLNTHMSMQQINSYLQGQDGL